jgi:hypothetical protein
LLEEAAHQGFVMLFFPGAGGGFCLSFPPEHQQVQSCVLGSGRCPHLGALTTEVSRVVPNDVHR